MIAVRCSCRPLSVRRLNDGGFIPGCSHPAIVRRPAGRESPPHTVLRLTDTHLAGLQWRPPHRHHPARPRPRNGRPFPSYRRRPVAARRPRMRRATTEASSAPSTVWVPIRLSLSRSTATCFRYRSVAFAVPLMRIPGRRGRFITVS